MTKQQETNKSNGPFRQEDLTELVLEPLAALVDRARLEILEKIQRIEDSVDMVAREFKRQVKPEDAEG